MDEIPVPRLRDFCLSCSYPTGGLTDDEEVAEMQLAKGLCGWCAGQRVRWRDTRREKLAAKQAAKEQPGRFKWWPFRRVMML